MQFAQHTSPYMHDNSKLSGVMLQVLLALVPGIVVYMYLFGWGILINILVATTTAVASEFVLLRMRRRPVAPFLSDYSAVVTAVLLALALPNLAPWWLIVIATLFAMIFGKHLYGGLGYNPFNPAMVGYVVAMISFPAEMTRWLAPATSLGLTDTLAIIFSGATTSGQGIDAITSATPIDSLRSALLQQQNLSEISQSPLFGTLGGSQWEWIALAFLLGGLYLIYKGIISWHIPVSMLASIALLAGLFNLINPEHYANSLFQLFSGGTILAAFFIATDPVSASTTPRGRIIYAAGIGILTYIIRTWGGYPDGIAFAVLLMNMAVPTIDYFTKPRVFGAGKP